MPTWLSPLLPASGLALCAACAGSPQTEPDFESLPYPFDAELIDVAVAAPQVALTGRPGAVASSTEVWGVSLDAPAALAIAPVDALGGFQLDLAAAATDRLRLHAVTTLGIEPADFTIDGDALVALDDCAAFVSLTLYRDFGGVVVGETDAATIELANRCADPISLTGSRALAATGGFTLELVPITLAAGATGFATARFAPTEAGDLVDYLAIEIYGHAPYVLTVRGRGE